MTVGSRVPGLVTQVPRRIRSVTPAIRVSSGYGSRHSTWLSNSQPYSNPAASAWRVSASVRSIVWSGLSVNPNCICPPPGGRRSGSAVLLQTAEPARMIARF